MLRPALLLFLFALQAPAPGHACQTWFGRLTSVFSLERLQRLLPPRRAKGDPALPPMDEAAERSIRHTYDGLLGTLGAHLHRATLARMEAQGDPFTVPEQKGAEFSSLQKKLHQFRELLRDSGRDGPAGLAVLRSTLVARMKALERAAERQERVFRPAYQVTPPRLGELLELSPDGKFAVTRINRVWGAGREKGNHHIIHLVELETGKETKVDVEGNFRGTPLLLPNGDFLLIQDRNLVRVPQLDGALNWRQAKPFSRSGLTSGFVIEGLQVSGDGKHAYLFWRGGGKGFQLKVFDLESGKVVGNTSLSPVLPGITWGILPGDRPAYWHIAAEQENLPGLSSVTFDDQGNPLSTPGTRPNTGMGRPLLWSPEGDLVGVYDRQDSSLKVSGRRDGQPEKTYDLSAVDQRIVHVAPHPTRPWVGVMRVGLEEKRVLEWVDMHTGEVAGSLKLPAGEFDSFSVSGDGENLVLLEAERRILVMRPEAN